ncbi:MAG: glycosyltransferase family 39 protein [Candidatus Curtissbacteria bacterium]|nr:glycosyltransferase family 39 protein [Candidatus Curtissbacteria bacterium]
MTRFLILVLVLFLAAYLRLNSLSKNPPGFYADEASVGFNAYKILTTGRDEHGKLMPVFFEAFGEYKNAFAIYPVVPLIAVFGVTETSVRLAQVIFGLLDILLIFFLGKALWSSAVGFISAFVLAISPWHVHISRFIIESHNAFLLFVMAGVLFLVLAKKNNWKTYYLVLSAIFFALLFYTYFATRIFTPIFLIGLLFFWRNDFLKLFKKYPKRAYLGIFLFLFILIPFVLHMASGKGLIRFNQISTKNNFTGSLNLYLKHFDPKFVFVYGDSDYPGQQIIRHSVSGMGLFYKWQLPFFAAGLLFLIFAGKKEKDARIIVFLMLALYPLGTVVSDATTPFATRSVIGIVPYSLLVAYGIWRVFGALKIAPLKLILVILIGFASFFYLNRFWQLYKTYENRAYGYAGFQYGAREIVEYFLSSDYQIKILESGFDGAQAYLNFYSMGNCAGCYVSDPAYTDASVRKLIAVSVDNLDAFGSRYEGLVVKKIYYPDGREAFYIFEATSLNSL